MRTKIGFSDTTTEKKTKNDINFNVSGNKS